MKPYSKQLLTFFLRQIRDESHSGELDGVADDFVDVLTLVGTKAPVLASLGQPHLFLVTIRFVRLQNRQTKIPMKSLSPVIL